MNARSTAAPMLLPCPFCNGPASLKSDPDTDMDSVFVLCARCGSRSPRHEYEKGLRITATKAVIAAWNRRASCAAVVVPAASVSGPGSEELLKIEQEMRYQAEFGLIGRSSVNAWADRIAALRSRGQQQASEASWTSSELVELGWMGPNQAASIRVGLREIIDRCHKTDTIRQIAERILYGTDLPPSIGVAASAARGETLPWPKQQLDTRGWLEFFKPRNPSGSNGKMFDDLRHRLRRDVDRGGYDGHAADLQSHEAAAAIEDLLIALDSQIEICNELRRQNEAIAPPSPGQIDTAGERERFGSGPSDVRCRQGARLIAREPTPEMMERCGNEDS